MADAAEKMKFDVDLEDNGYRAQVVKDSIAPNGKRLRTVAATYPRIVHSELLTHRAFARNSASSRAIPWPKMMEAVRENPVVPLKFGMEKPGMQIGEELPPELAEYARQLWLEARDLALMKANALHNIGKSYLYERQQCGDFGPGKEIPAELAGYADIKVHKSIPNRITEPWMWLTVVITATEWNNFFRLRCHPDAEQHIRKIAEMIREALTLSKPQPVDIGEWHLPFITDNERNCPIEQLKAASTARAARVSYLTHDGIRSMDKDFELFNKLMQGSGFGHMSPPEHVATPAETAEERSGPFIGWKQFRKEFANENLPG